MADTRVSSMTQATSVADADLLYLVAGGSADRKVEARTLLDAFGVFGALQTVGNSTGQTGLSADTWTNVSQWATDLFSEGAAPDESAEKITLTSTGVYLCVWSFSFSGTADTFGFRLTWNGAGDSTIQTKTNDGSAVDSVTLVTIVDATTAAGDLLAQVRVEGSGGDFTMEDGLLVAVRLKGT